MPNSPNIMRILCRQQEELLMRDLGREESNIVQLAQGNADKEGYEGLLLKNDGNATRKY